MDPLRPSGRVRPREHSPETGTASSRSVRARTAGPGQGHGESPPLSPRRTAEGAPAARLPSSSLPPRAAAPQPLRAPLPGLSLPQSASEHAWQETAASSPSSQASSGPESPRSDDDTSSIGSSEHLLEELGALGIHGPLGPSQLLDLVALSTQRPDMEDRIRQAAAALTERHMERSLKMELETLWRQHRHSHPVAARVIELVMDPESAAMSAALSLEGANGAPDPDTELEAGVDATAENPRKDPLDDGDGDAGLEGGLDGDVKLLEAPLGDQIQAWMGQASLRVVPDLHAFDDEPQAPAFARMLERLRDEALPDFSPAATALLQRQVSTALLAMARDANLRHEVYLVSQTALGDCRDNLLEGFSKVMLVVRNWQMVQGVRAGKINEAQLNGLTGQQFRLSLLETATNRLMQQLKQSPDLPPWKAKWLEQDPLETMAHAKAALKAALQLPPETVQDLSDLWLSALNPDDIAALHSEVLAQASDPQTYPAFLMQHETWRAGMQELHKATFESLETARDNDPFHQLPYPADHQSPAAFEYARQASEVYSAWEASVDAHLQPLAARAGGAMPPNHRRPPEAGPSGGT